MLEVDVDRVQQVSNPQNWSSPLLRQRLAEGAEFRNISLSYASQMLKAESARLNPQLAEDFKSILRGNTVYIRNFICEDTNLSLYHTLKKELVEATGATMTGSGGLIEWSKHQVFDNPSDISPTFNDMIDMLAEYFDVDVYATRLNYYRDGTQWKPQHHDSHAYGGRALREDFTVGLTLGSNRQLLFIHEASKFEFSFPQTNGDCFAFTGEVNQLFTHGVPKVRTPVGDRFSIIAWGRRRSLNERNGGVPNPLSGILKDKTINTVEDAVEAAKTLVSTSHSHSSTVDKTGERSAKKRKNRLQ